MSTEFIKTIKNDVYGNERNVIHFFHILRDVECEAILLANKSANVGKSIADDDYKCYLDDAYEYAIEKTKKIGGKKFHNKSFGGGIVFTCPKHKLIEKLKEIF